MTETCFVPPVLSARNEGVSRNRRGADGGPKGQIPIGPFVLGQAVRSQDIEDRAFLEGTSPTTHCKNNRCVTLGGDGQAALCAADRAGDVSQQGASGGVSDPL
jgi:hypothetical protein